MNLTIAAAQYPITEHKSLQGWKDHTQKWIIEATSQKAQLLFFPEYGSMELVSLFSETIRKDLQGQVREMEKLRHDFICTFEAFAKKHKVIIVAPSFPTMENSKIYNRAYVFSPKGLVGFQDKFFMTRFEHEHWGINSGKKVLSLFEADWGSFGIQICYDVEFALGGHLLCAAGASVILAPSCTETLRGATRVHIGARARALEAQAYTAVSQTIGLAEWSPAVDINYGYSAFYCTPDLNLPEEGILSRKTAQSAGWHMQTVDLSVIDDVRCNGQVLNFKDHKRYRSQFNDEEVSIVRWNL